VSKEFKGYGTLGLVEIEKGGSAKISGKLTNLGKLLLTIN